MRVRWVICTCAVFLLPLIGVGMAQPVIPNCSETIPDPESMAFCDGGVQSTCENIESAPQCTGTKKTRSSVTQNCAEGKCYNHCTQREVLCWIEYHCLWNYQQDRCETGETASSSTIMAKSQAACARDIKCEAPR